MGKRLTPQERAWREVKEKELQADLMKLAKEWGWKPCHFHDSRRMVTRGGKSFMIGDADAKGFPDLVLARPPEILFVELKAELGDTSPEQDEWLALLDGCGLTTMVIRPSNREILERKLMTRRPVS